MNRREFIQLAGLTAVSAGVSQSHAAPAPPAAPAPFGPVLTNVTPDGVTLIWSAGQPATGWVEFGDTEQLGRRADGADAGLLPYADRLLTVRLTGLTPGKKYYYRTHSTPVDFRSAYNIQRGQDVPGLIGSFTTLDPAAAEAHFVVWNDTHERRDTVRKLADLRGQPDFLFWNGDVVNEINSEDEIPTKYLDPAGGQPYADQVPVLFSRGNHAVRGRAARSLDRYVGGPGGAFYHWFRHGPVAFVVLDTGEDKPDDTPAYAGLAGFAAYREQQRAWLEQVIQQDAFRSAPFRVVFAHIPLVWDAPVPHQWTALYGDHRGWVCDDGLARWGNTLAAARIDLVISGHTHHHAWFPATPTRPWPQLIGGGPALPTATMINCHATPDHLDLTMTLVASGQVAVKESLSRRI